MGPSGRSTRLSPTRPTRTAATRSWCWGCPPAAATGPGRRGQPALATQSRVHGRLRAAGQRRDQRAGGAGARINTFQGGAIYWSPTTGAHVVYGAIGAEYAALAHETDAYGRDAQLVLGLPTSDEMDVPGVPGAA